MALTHEYTKLRSQFGCQPMFSVTRVDMCDSITSDPTEQRQYILRNPVHTITQHTPNYSHCEVNTIRAEYATSGANHAEGGWPEGVNVNDPEATQRYRRKIEKDDGYIHCIMASSAYSAHLGTVWHVERNPGFLKNFLTVGDWTARVWSEDCRESAILWTPPARHRICDGTWSPTRLSLLLLAQYDGRLCLWDLLRRHHEPVLTVQVCDDPLISVRGHEAGTLVICGSTKGDIYMQELSASLAASDKNDKALLTLMLERESKRERILEARMREIKVKQRQADEGSPTHSTSEMDATIGDKDLADAALEFMQVAKKELAAL